MSETIIDIQEIFEYLPQRPPFLLVDRVIDFVPGESLVAIKNITINEPFFVGHFPGRPIMPGVLMLEALAQASTVFAFKSLGEKASNGALFYFAGIDDARFKRVVTPGDQLRLEVKLLKTRHSIWKIEGVAKVGDEVACSAILMSARKENEEKE